MVELQLSVENRLYAVATFVGGAVCLLEQNGNLKVGETHETQNDKPEVGLC